MSVADAVAQDADAGATFDGDGAGLDDGADGLDGGEDGIEGGADGTGGDAAGADVDGGPRDAESETHDADAARVDAPGRDGGCTGPTQPHDEDGDGVDDACDNCPSIPNANQADQGEISAGLPADGVGDACDPRPNLAGDAILLFDGLVSGQVGAEWLVYAGTWLPGADTLAETAVGMSQEIDRTGLAAQADYLVETRFSFDALPSPDSRATLVFRMDTGLHNGWGCAVTNRSTLALSTITNGAAGELAPPTTAIPAPQVGNRYRVQAGAYAGSIYCFLPDTGERVTRTNLGYPMGAPGLRTHLGAATFEYLLVYRLGGALP